MAGLADATTGLREGTGLQFQTQIGGAWSPLSLFTGSNAGTLGLWYDPSNLSTMYQEISSPSTPTTAGNVVGTMYDLSGNGNTGIAPTNGQRATLTYSSGNYYVLGNNSNNAGLQFSGVDMSLGGYIACAVLPFSLVVLETLLSSLNDTCDVRRSTANDYRANGNSSNGADFCFPGGSTWINGVSGFSFSGNHVVEVSNSAYTATGPTTFNAVLLAAYMGRAGNFGFAGLIIMNRLPSAAEQARIRTYLGAKIGLSL